MSQPQFMTMPRSSQSTNGAEDSPISGTSNASPPTMRLGSNDVEQAQRPASIDIQTRRGSVMSPSNPAAETRQPPLSPDRPSRSSLPPSQTSPVADTRSQPQPRQTTLPLPSTTMAAITATQTLSPSSPSGGGQGRRSPAPRLPTLPPPPTRFNIEGGSARLSPSVISRHPPFPILNLPTIPTPTPGPSQPRRIRPQSRLSSMPALPREGRDDSHQQADHENAMLAESDEEEEMEGEEEFEEAQQGSDDEEGDEAAYAAPSRQSESSYREGLPHVESSPFDVSFLNGKKDGATGERTPIGRRALDYFSSKPVAPEVSSPTRTPRPGEGPRHQPLLVPMPTPGSPRPQLYQQASRSMVDLLSARQPRSPGLEEQAQAKVKSPELGPSLDGVAPPKSPPPPRETDLLGSPLRRRRSMPTFSLSTDPPPYPAFPARHKAPVVQPREDEGKEQLPTYTNTIYLAAIMPRKMEFTAPGVQAKDRKWRRVFCVLEGTMFRVYKCPAGAAGVNPVVDWWEKKVGVGDQTNTTGTTYDGRIRIDSVRPREAVERPLKLNEETRRESASEGREGREEQRKEQTRSKRFTVSLLHPSRHSNSPTSSTSPSRFGRSSLDISRGDASSSGRPSLTLGRPPSQSSSSASTSHVGSSSQGGATSSSSVTSASASGQSRFRKSNSSRHSTDKDKGQELPVPDDKDLLRVYTMQHAESGLGSDYLKRRNVIRVRMEGEQFLLQASDVAAVVDWIEGFQGSTNIALDLDERPMPKGPMFPRRRRRRIRRPEEAAGQAEANVGDDPTGTRPP
ncbi:hypothetical protein OE88DRAFT_1739190 [Heliocybe sulcata]|uniref:PH domain-containing protein n=1 Tax=Heliocybe sulcata TaxID=5364 RepID=A0A5C3MN12_9AGAM|nr:hypothetical protein OE88DRAFT_1739190 [Heliocybe sulcata]